MNARLANLFVAIAIVALAGSVSPVEASIINIPITNFSFETPDASPPPGYTRTDPPGWTGTVPFDDGAVYDPVHSPDGIQFGWMFNSSLWQQTSAPLTAGVNYQLSLAVARDIDAPVDITYALYSGTDFATGTLLASGTASPASGAQNFQNVTLTFGPDSPGYAALLAAYAGENIIVAFTSNSTHGSSGDVDNVQLLEIIPEPASLGLLACGSLMMLRRRRA